MARILVVEPHSDDSCIGAGGFLLKNKSENELAFVLLTASDINFAHRGWVKRSERLREYRDYINTLGGDFIDGIDPLDAEGRLDMVPRLDLVSMIDRALQEFEPETIIVQGPSFHHDHVATYESVVAATRPTRSLSVDEILVMENPTYVHSPYPTQLGIPNVYVQLSEELVDKKLELFESCFPSQQRTDENCLSPSGIKAWARYRGVEARCMFAEAFISSFRRI